MIKFFIKIFRLIISFFLFIKFKFFKEYYKTQIFNQNFIHFKSYKDVVKNSLNKLDEESKKYNILQESLAKSNDLIFIDIGAAVGIRSIIVNNFLNFKKMILIEPNEENFKLLSKNIERVKKKANLYNFALGNKDGEGYLSFPFWVYNSLKVNSYGQWSLLGNNFFFKKKVKIFKFDNFFKNEFNNENESYFIKIDVEGYEPYVLEGMNEFLSKNRNIIIEIELNKRILKHIENLDKKLLEQLKKSEFDVFIYDNNLRKLVTFNYENFENSNKAVIDLICIKKIN